MVKPLSYGFIFLLGILSYSVKSSQSPPSAPATIAVTSVSPKVVTWKKTISATGEVAPWQEAILASQIAGQSIVSLNVDVGDRVKKGQIVAKLSNASIQARIRSADAQLRQADVNLSQAKSNRDRALKLKEKESISDQEIDQIVAHYEISLAQQQEIAANREFLENEIRLTTIQAPDDGIVSARLASLGQVVTVGSELFRLIRKGQLEWRGQFQSSVISEIKPGQAVLVDGPEGSKINGVVSRIDPAVNLSTRLASINVALPQGDVLKAGMFLGGQVVLNDRTLISVPEKSVILRDGKTFVAKIIQENATSKIHMAPVSVGQRNGTDVEIISTIVTTDLLVMNGAGLLNEGDVVNVIRN
ncbi:MAG: hypothetical protein B0W54_21515 [Cellvibrio sp. 79]|nr:MAG: hypothetical protein B0W54_21515 [Cellvibrio sp. 79]